MDLLSIHKVAARISFSRSWILREIKEGRFPKPLKLNFGKNLWNSDTIDDWIEARLKNAASE